MRLTSTHSGQFILGRVFFVFLLIYFVGEKQTLIWLELFQFWRFKTERPVFLMKAVSLEFLLG